MSELPPPENDGLYIPKAVGDWSRHKHYFLGRYIDVFTKSMQDKRWSGLHYIDLFAGAGVVRLRDSEELDWTSSLIAAQAPTPFDGLHLCDLSRRRIEALEARLAALRPTSVVQVLRGDANQKVHEILRTISRRTLSLAFLDPYGLHLRFETIQTLSARRADLIIFFPDHLDALRNCKYVYHDAPNDSKLDRFLGPNADWRAALNAAPQEKWAEVLRDLYRHQLQELGYRCFEYERIRARKHPLYLLIFCSRHPTAAMLWRNIASTKPDGQRTLDFGEPD
ncbi:MAG: three-Cys-motif partner protein TcmP [Phycisphaerae bacterium]|jgi:three-Cys-motif partner protein